jgi:hypothetical protein
VKKEYREISGEKSPNEEEEKKGSDEPTIIEE